MKNVISVIQKQYPYLSAVEKKIADYILTNPGKVIYMTTAVLSKELKVSEGSLINFSNMIGFKGFSALKMNLAQNLPQQEKLIAEDTVPDDSPQAVLEKLSREIFESFRMTITSAGNETLERAASLICSKKRIEIYGVGSSSMIAEDIYYRFMRQNLPAYSVTDPHIASISASMLDKDSLVIAISHSGRTVETIQASRIAKEHEAALIALTSCPDSPLGKLSDLCLVSVSREASSFKEAEVSRHAQLLLLDGLLRYISLKNVDRSVRNMENVAEIIGKHRI